MNPTQPLPGQTPPPFGTPPLGQPTGGGGNDQWPIYLAIGCAALGLFCFCGIGVSGLAYWFAQGGGLGGHTRVHVVATVTDYLGLGAGIGPGTSCDLPITAQTLQDGSQQCHVLMTCAGVPLYGDAQSGFFPCQFNTSSPLVIGADPETSMVDHDGAFSINTSARTVSLSDDFMGRSGMFVLTASITSVTAE
jgi:hypothetical protein